jgi:hypothetical protein
MQVARNGLSARRWVVIALVGALGLMVVASGSNAVGSGPGHAVTAKKCKKHKRSAAASKKKKCKKVRHVVLPAPGPLVRATLAWSAPDEVDLHAFDASGNHAGWVNTGVVQGIPNAHHGGDLGPGGPSETFIDDIFVVGGPSNREFSYVACLYDGPGPGDYTATFTGVTKTGATSTLPLAATPSDGTDVYTLTTPGGPAIPNPGAVC